MKNISLVVVIAFLLAVQLFSAEKAADFKLENMDGKQVKLSDFQKEGLVILDFWATWCVPCKKGLPKLNELHKKYEEVNVLAICTDKPRKKATATSLVKSSKYEFNTLFDLKKVVQKQYNVTNIPRTIVIDQDGTIIYDHTGYQRGDEKHYEEIIVEWLEKQEKKQKLESKSTVTGDTGIIKTRQPEIEEPETQPAGN